MLFLELRVPLSANLSNDNPFGREGHSCCAKTSTTSKSKAILISVVLSLGLELLQTSSFLHRTKKILEAEDQNYSQERRSQTDQNGESLKVLELQTMFCQMTFMSKRQAIS